MSANVEKIIDIVGVALILGLMLRYGKQASELIAAGESFAVHGFQAVSLQKVG